MPQQHQREIIYTSFGPLSNHISTHFWNAQQAYFTYDDDGDAPHHRNRDADDDDDDERGKPFIDHDTSFKAGRGADGSDTYSPRTLIFETQQELGSLARLNPLYRSFDLDDDDDDGEGKGQLLEQLGRQAIGTWGQPAIVQGQQRVRKSEYQKRLESEDMGIDIDDDDEEEVDDDDDDDDNQAQTNQQPPTDSSAAAQSLPRRRRSPRFRFWSDYSRVYYHPKSLIPVGGQLMAPMSGSYNGPSPAVGDGRTQFEGYEQGYAFFQTLERDSETMDDNLRWFAEDADLLQGFQHTINTSDAFGGLGTAYIEAIADEYPKATQIVFAPSWGPQVAAEDEDEGQHRLARVRRMNDVLALTALVESADTVVPLYSPTLRRAAASGAEEQPGWLRRLARFDEGDMHHVSALMAAHIETATLGARLRTRPTTLSALSSRLNWRRDTPLAHLGGCLPLPFSSPSLPPTSTATTTAIDPIEALLSSRGYGTRSSARSHDEPSASQRAETGAKQLEAAWLDLSIPPAAVKGKASKKVLEGVKRSYAASVMVREEGEEADPRTALGSLDRFVALREPMGEGPNHPSTTASQISSLYTTSSTSHLLTTLLSTLTEAIGGHLPLSSYGIGTGSGGGNEGQVGGRDGLKEVRERVEGLVDSYGGGLGGGEEDGVGTDEEFEVAEEEWDL